MALVIYNNTYSIVAQNRLATANSAIAKSIERLSSGLRINHASDDASGLAISEKLRSQIRGLAKASLNAQDATSFLQTAEGGMEVIGDMLQRMRELAVQAGNGTYTTNDRKELQKEVDQLKAEINRISASTEYNTKKLLTGDSAALWSTNNSSVIQAIVRGAPAEGNYKIEMDAVTGLNYVYKSDVMEYQAAQKTVDTYDYTLNASGFSNVSFSNVYGEISKEFEVTSDYKAAAAGAVVTSLATAGIYTGKLATGEDSTLAAATYALTGATATLVGVNYGYIEIEAIADLDMSKVTLSATNFHDYFKVSTYDRNTGIKSEWTANPTAVANDVVTIAAGFNLTLGTAAKIADGDKLLLSRQAGAAAAANTGIQVRDNGQRYYTGATGTAAQPNILFSVVLMDDGGNVTVGQGRVDIPILTATSPQAKLTVTPTLVSKKLLEVDESTTTANVNAANTRIIGGIYPNGAEVKIYAGGAVLSATRTGGIYIQDSNLHVASVVNGTAATARSGSYMIEFLEGGTLDTLDPLKDNFRIIFKDAATGLETELTAVSATSTVAFGQFTYSATNSIIVIDGTTGAAGTGITVDLTATGTGKATADDKILLKTAAAATALATNARVELDGLSFAVLAAQIDEFDVYNVELDAGGNFVKSRIQISLQSNSAGSIFFKTPESKVADLTTKLRDIPLFTNADGKNILDNTQELTVFANGNTATVYVEGSDTIEDFQNKLNDALLKLGLGSGDSVVDSNLVHYVTEEEATEGGNFALAGTFILQGAIAGNNSKINVIGDQDLINALSLSTLQTGKESELEVTVRDAHNNKLIGKDTIGDGVLRGIIKGIDVKISNPQLLTSYNSATGKLTFTAPAEPTTVNLHVVDNRTEVQIGANEGQTFDVSIAQMNTTSLEIDDAFVVTMDESQKAITKFSQALEKVTSARATIGAQINRLEYTVKNLSISRENLISAESRIRDLDIAEESATFARNQILVNAATAMLAQANTLPQIALQLLQ